MDQSQNNDDVYFSEQRDEYLECDSHKELRDYSAQKDEEFSSIQKEDSMKNLHEDFGEMGQQDLQDRNLIQMTSQLTTRINQMFNSSESEIHKFIDSEIDKMKKMLGSHLDDQIFYVNVGGKKFQTAIQTILKFPNSKFAQIYRGEVVVPLDKDQYLFIDRSGDAFRYILEYMRTGRLIEPKSSFQKYIFYQDLKFYNIQYKNKKYGGGYNKSRGKVIQEGQKIQWKWDKKTSNQNIHIGQSNMIIENQDNNWGIALSSQVFSKGISSWAFRVLSFPTQQYDTLIFGIIENNITNQALQNPHSLTQYKDVFCINGQGQGFGMQLNKQFQVLQNDVFEFILNQEQGIFSVQNKRTRAYGQVEGLLGKNMRAFVAMRSQGVQMTLCPISDGLYNGLFK